MIFDETKGGIRSILDAAAEKTAGAIEGSKTMVERARLRSQLNDAYRRYGKAAGGYRLAAGDSAGADDHRYAE